jgi:hypothetical protein
MNYARRGLIYVFFENELPPELATENLEEWAFYDLPLGYGRSTFCGKMIGEDQERRCYRLRHAPKSKACTVCHQNAAMARELAGGDEA